MKERAFFVILEVGSVIWISVVPMCDLKKQSFPGWWVFLLSYLVAAALTAVVIIFRHSNK